MTLTTFKIKLRSYARRLFQSNIGRPYARLFLYGAAALVAGTVIFCVPGILRAQKNTAPAATSPGKNLPHYREIMEIIRPLNYSGFYVIQKPGVSLSIDFKNRTWTLHNVRHYTPDGTLLLDEGRNGLCAELAYYTFQKIKPFLGKLWEIKFARATEPGFFSALESNHVVLLLGDPATQAAYLLDPSFHRYGSTTQLSQYAVLGAKDGLLSFEKKDPDATIAVDGSFPLLIRNNSIVLLSVGSVSGSVNPQNLTLAISAKRRDETSGDYLMILRRQGSQTEWLEEESAIKKLFTPGEVEEIKKKFIEWMKTL